MKAHAVRDAAMAAVVMLAWTSASAAPALHSTSGTFSHKATVTLTGSGFGTKGVAAPVVWDDASGTNILSKWSGVWPSNSPDSSRNLAYRTPIRGVGLPHSNVTRYIAGGAADAGANGGWNIMMWKTRTVSSYPYYSYFSWYQRADDNWVFEGDNNYKVWDFSKGSEPYDLTANWYLEYNSRPESRSSTPSWHMLDDGSTGLDGNSSNWWWGSAINPMSGTWTKIELEIRYDNTSNGYVKLWENGALKVNYKGRTDGYSGTTRAEAVGGYIRSYNANNWRYYADVYLDYSRARVLLANASELSRATIVEPQIPSAWNDGTVQFTVNLGRLSTGQTAYLFVVDGNGAVSTTGLSVNIGGGSTAAAPMTLTAPTNLRVSQ